MLKTAWLWLIKSSSDPQKMSLTVKSILVGVIPFLALVGVDTSHLPQGVDFLVGAVEQALIIVSAVTALIGFARKLKTTVLGTNAVLNSRN